MVAALSFLLALALSLAAYLAYALQRARRGAGVHRPFDTLLTTVEHFVSREVATAREEAQRARQLIRDAVAQLHAGLATLKEQSQEQAGLVAVLAEPESPEAPGILGFAQEARGLMAGLTHVLNTGSHESVKTVQTIERMARQLDGLFELLGDLDGLSRRTSALADTANLKSESGGEPAPSLPLVADEVRHLAEAATDFNARMRGLVGEAKATVAIVRERVEATAERDMNASIEAKMRADALADQAVSINRTLASGVREAFDNSRRIEEGVGAAAVALEFEETAVRALEAIEAHLASLATISGEAAVLREILGNPSQTPLLRERALERFRRQLQLRRI